MARQSQPLTSLIIEMLQRDHLLTATQLLEGLKAQGASYNKTSLYRALDKLMNQSTICKLNFGDNDIQYELRSAHHDHMVCLRCGKISSSEYAEEPKKNINGFLVDHHHYTYFGTCVACQQQAATA